MTTAELDRAIAAEDQLAKQLRKYAGRWVAVYDHKIVASADSGEDLLEQVVADEIDGIFKVPEEGSTALL
jgi:putative hemolysin